MVEKAMTSFESVAFMGLACQGEMFCNQMEFRPGTEFDARARDGNWSCNQEKDNFSVKLRKEKM